MTFGHKLCAIFERFSLLLGHLELEIFRQYKIGVWQMALLHVKKEVFSLLFVKTLIKLSIRPSGKCQCKMRHFSTWLNFTWKYWRMFLKCAKNPGNWKVISHCVLTKKTWGFFVQLIFNPLTFFFTRFFLLLSVFIHNYGHDISFEFFKKEIIVFAFVKHDQVLSYAK